MSFTRDSFKDAVCWNNKLEIPASPLVGYLEVCWLSTRAVWCMDMQDGKGLFGVQLYDMWLGNGTVLMGCLSCSWAARIIWLLQYYPFPSSSYYLFLDFPICKYHIIISRMGDSKTSAAFQQKCVGKNSNLRNTLWLVTERYCELFDSTNLKKHNMPVSIFTRVLLQIFGSCPMYRMHQLSYSTEAAYPQKNLDQYHSTMKTSTD